MFYLFILLFAALAFKVKSDRGCYLTLVIIPIAFYVTSILMESGSFTYSDYVFAAVTFEFILVSALCFFFSSNLALRQSVILIGAIIAHTLMLLDLKSGSSFVYDDYEAYITLITLIQMVFSHDRIINAFTGPLKSILLLLYVRYFSGSSGLHSEIKNKTGAFRA